MDLQGKLIHSQAFPAIILVFNLSHGRLKVSLLSVLTSISFHFSTKH